MSGIVGSISSRNSVVGQLSVKDDVGHAFTLQQDDSAIFPNKPNWTSSTTLLNVTNSTGAGQTESDTLQITPTTKVNLTRGNLMYDGLWYEGCFAMLSHYNTTLHGSGDSQGGSGHAGFSAPQSASHHCTIGSVLQGVSTSHGVANKNNWFGAHPNSNYPTRDVWFVIDLGADRPSCKIARLTYSMTWGTGNCTFQLWGTHTKPSSYRPLRRSTHTGGNAGTQGRYGPGNGSFDSYWRQSNNWVLILDHANNGVGSGVARDTGWGAASVVDNYRYYCFRINETGAIQANYDHGIDGMVIYGDYY